MSNSPVKRGPRLCKVCKHRDVGLIELALASGRTLTSVGTEFGLDKSVVQRHWTRHVGTSRKAELMMGPVQAGQLAKKACEENISLLDYLALLRAKLFGLFEEARSRGHTFDCASIAGKITHLLEVMAKITGELKQGGGVVINNSVSSSPTIVLNDPSIVKMQSIIIRALSKHPQARVDVVAALRAFETPAVRPNGHEAPMIEARACDA
jgi:hypothetical protein